MDSNRNKCSLETIVNMIATALIRLELKKQKETELKEQELKQEEQELKQKSLEDDKSMVE